jgi:hypothetical protein
MFPSDIQALFLLRYDHRFSARKYTDVLIPEFFGRTKLRTSSSSNDRFHNGTKCKVYGFFNFSSVLIYFAVIYQATTTNPRFGFVPLTAESRADVVSPSHNYHRDSQASTSSSASRSLPVAQRAMSTGSEAVLSSPSIVVCYQRKNDLKYRTSHLPLVELLLLS